MRLDIGNRKGQTAVLFTLAIVPLLGVVGLVVDIGWVYYRKQAAQTAADAAASAAAATAFAAAGGKPTCGSAGVACSPTTEFVCPSNIADPPGNNILMGCLYAKENGFVTAGRQKVTIQSGIGSAPTSSGVTISYWVTARVSERIPQLFSAVLGFPESTVVARATTGTREASAGGCVITLEPTETAMVLSGTVSLRSGCGVYVNSSNAVAINTNGGGSITTTGDARTQIVGGCNGCQNITPPPQTGAPRLTDPFADMQPPPFPGNCQPQVTLSNNQSTTISQGCFNGVDIGSQTVLNLNPGIYWIKGNLHLGGHAAIHGHGVMIYMENGGVSMDGQTTIDLQAPSSGYYQGILFDQPINNRSPSSLVGGSGQSMSGVLYFPGAPLTYTGNSGGAYTQTTLVSNTLTMVGTSNISAASNTNFTGNQGGAFLIE